jgi:hypothetical protein
MINGQRSTALTLAKASAMAYANDGVVVGYGTCQASITTDDEKIIVAYKGTDNIREWISNMDRLQIDTDHGRVHRGVNDSMNRCYSDVLKYISGTRKQIWTTGHSRGAMQALITSARFAGEGIQIAGCYTFGSPRVGDSKFAKWCNKNINNHYRFVNESDPVPLLPHFDSWMSAINPLSWPLVWKNSYKHCGTVRWFDGDDWRSKQPTLDWLKTWATKRDKAVGDGLTDHYIENYIRALT